MKCSHVYLSQLMLMNRYRLLSKLFKTNILLQELTSSQFYFNKTFASIKHLKMDPAEQAKKAAACKAIDDSIKVVITTLVWFHVLNIWMSFFLFTQLLNKFYIYLIICWSVKIVILIIRDGSLVISCKCVACWITEP